MQPGGVGGGLAGPPAARQQPADHPRQHVARPRRGQPGRGAVIDGGADRHGVAGRADHRVGAFQQHGAAAHLRDLLDGGHLAEQAGVALRPPAVLETGEQPLELTHVGRQHHARAAVDGEPAVDVVDPPMLVLRQRGERVGVQHQRHGAVLRRQRRLQQRHRRRTHAQPRPHHQRVHPAFAQQVRQRLRAVHAAQHDRIQPRRVFRHRLGRRAHRHQPGADAQRAARRQPRSAAPARAADQHQHMAMIVFVRVARLDGGKRRRFGQVDAAAQGGLRKIGREPLKPDVGHQQPPAQIRPLFDIVADLGRVKRDRHARAQRKSARAPGVETQARRRIHRDAPLRGKGIAPGALVKIAVVFARLDFRIEQGVERRADLCGQRARQAAAEQRIDDHMGAGPDQRQIGERAHRPQRLPAAPRVGRVRRRLRRVAQAQRRDAPPRLRQQARDHIAVAAVAARPAQHDRAPGRGPGIGDKPRDLRSHGRPCALHQLSPGDGARRDRRRLDGAHLIGGVEQHGPLIPLFMPSI